LYYNFRLVFADIQISEFAKTYLWSVKRQGWLIIRVKRLYIRITAGVFTGIFLILAGGLFYQKSAAMMGRYFEEGVSLPVALEEFPMEFEQWQGKAVPISETVLEVAGNDDFLSRTYVNQATGSWFTVFVGFSGHPRTMLGHRPEVCYPSAGWISQETEQGSFITSSGRVVDCLIHEFLAPDGFSEIVVLNYYIVNGQITNDEDLFMGFGWRLPNFSGDIARYVAQVQISSVSEVNVRAGARDITEKILRYFPDENGLVKAVSNKE
jgi:hypothetical protein